MSKIREIRKNLGITQKEIATRLNKSIACVSDWERGRTEPSISDLIDLADFFTCSIDYLLGRESEDGVIILAGGENRPAREIDIIYDKLTILNQGIAIGYLRKLLEEQQAAF